MKKVLFVASITRHINIFHIPYLKYFKEQGYEVHVASSGEQEIQFCDKHFNIRFARNPLDKANQKAYKDLKEIIYKGKYDIIHCHTPTASALTRIAAREARKTGTKVIYTAHGFHFYKGASLKNWLIFYPIEWFLSKYTDTLVLINKEDYDVAMSHFSNRVGHIEYIPGIGVDEKKYKIDMTIEDRRSLRANFDIKPNDFVIVYPARLCKDKNQILLLQLMKEIKYDDVKLLLPGSDEYSGFYQNYVQKNKIKNVIFIGERDDIPQLLKISDLLIASSIREGFGINLVEALACEVPVIAVDNRGHREIIQDGINGYIIPNKLKDLEEKFNMLYEDKELYKKIKSNCYESAKKFFLDNSLKKMKDIYNI